MGISETERSIKNLLIFLLTFRRKERCYILHSCHIRGRGNGFFVLFCNIYYKYFFLIIIIHYKLICSQYAFTYIEEQFMKVKKVRVCHVCDDEGSYSVNNFWFFFRTK